MSFPMVALGEVLTKSDEWIDLYPNEQYRQVKVRLWGKGVMLREEISGTQIAASKRLVVHSQQFIVSRIDARNGAFGLIPDSLDGAVVSSDFPVFTVNPSRILPKYLNWMSKTHFFVDLCKAASEGTTNRVRLKEDRFLMAKIPLPPLPEQRRIVARIEELAAKIEEARGLRKKAGEETKIIIAYVLGKIFNKGTDNRFKYRLVRDAITEHKQGYYNNSKFAEGDVYFARITDITNDAYLNYSGMPRITIDDDTLDSFRVQPNDFLFARTGGAGRFAIATKELNCVFASYLIRFRFKPDYRPEFLRYYFWSPRFQEEIRSSIHGGANQNIHAEDIKEATVPILSETEQHRIVAYLDELQAKVDALRRLKAETGAELDALLPAVLDRAFKGEL